MKVFITLDSYDVEFIRTLQTAVKHKTGYRPIVDRVIRAVLRDYKQLLERRSDPDFLAAYRSAELNRRGPRGKDIELEAVQKNSRKLPQKVPIVKGE